MEVNGVRVEDFRDACDLTAPIFELLTASGRCFWVPLDRVRRMVFQPPRRLIDLIWRPVEVETEGGPDGIVFMPTIYALTADSDDAALKLGRRTDWATGERQPLAQVQKPRQPEAFLMRRDLEDLLNTRRRPVGWGAKLPEVETALTNYGIADFTAQPVSSDDDRERLRAGIETAIRQAEPRFRAVAVHLLDNSEAGDRTLRLRIDALVAAEPAPEPMSFDGVVDPADRGVRVTATSDGGLI